MRMAEYLNVNYLELYPIDHLNRVAADIYTITFSSFSYSFLRTLGCMAWKLE